MGTATIINILFALGSAVVAVCSISRMTPATSHSVRYAMVLLTAGLAGQSLAAFFSAWAPYFDALLYGGITALLLASRRVEGRVSVHSTQRWSIAVSACTFIYFFLWLSF